MHNSCCACAYQLLCKRTTAVVRPKILTVSTTYPISSSNLSYLFQQLILSLPATDSISFNNMTYIYQQQDSWSMTLPVSRQLCIARMAADTASLAYFWAALNLMTEKKLYNHCVQKGGRRSSVRSWMNGVLPRVIGIRR